MKILFNVFSLVILLSTFTSFACTNTEIKYEMDQIGQFISQHPGAADTLEGVHYFWVNESTHIRCTEMALYILEADGILERVKSSGSRTIWRRRRE